MNNITITHADKTAEVVQGEVYWVMPRTTTPDNKDQLLVAVYVKPEHWRNDSIKIVSCEHFYVERLNGAPS